MPTLPIISVVMPAYNAEKYIAEAIDSVLGQRFTAWELIIMDDGSTDGTMDIILSKAGSDKRITYLQQPHAGQARARNAAIAASRGEYIALLDADDWWMPMILQDLLHQLQQQDVDLVFCDAYIFRDKINQDDRLNSIPGFYEGQEGLRKFLRGNQVSCITMLAKKAAIDSVKGFSETKEIHEDYDLWLRMLIAGSRFYGIDAVYACYRRHDQSSTLDAGKVLRYDINTLQGIGVQWPAYRAEINEVLAIRIRHYLATNNVNNREFLVLLLNTLNELQSEKIKTSLWKKIYVLGGKDMFRVLFHWKAKIKSPVSRYSPGILFT